MRRVTVHLRYRNGIYTRLHALLNHVPLADKLYPKINNNGKAAPIRRKLMLRTAPPFRADHVGSLLRPPALKEARLKRERNEIAAEALRAVEDREIERAIKKQEEIGLKLATDGEFRRTWWHFDFFRGLDGVKFYLTDHGIQFHGVQTKAHALKIDGRIGFPVIRCWSISSF